MSPEQARGKPVDKRADIWAFGVVLCEMLTGQRLFKGETISDTLAAVLKEEPDLERVPAKLRRLLAKCLEKDPKRRLRDIGDAFALLEDGRNAAPSQLRLGIAASIVVGVLFLALGILSFIHFREVPLQKTVVRYTIAAAENATSLHSLAISPDGHYVALASEVNGKRQLWLRALDSLQTQPMPGTDDAKFPFWSPDSRYIGFFAQGKLKKIAANGGPAQSLCDAADGRGGSWNREDVILFSPNSGVAMQRISAAGGRPVDVIGPKGLPRFPVFLPDGHHFLYLAPAASERQNGIYLSSLDGRENRRVLPDISSVAFAAGRLLFIRENILMTQPFDPVSGQIAGDVFPVHEGVFPIPNINYAPATLSETGVLLYVSGGASGNQLAWYDRGGRLLETIGAPGPVGEPAISPDEASVVFQRLTPSGSDLWIRDLTRGVDQRFTTDAFFNVVPCWSPKGDHIAFISSRGGGVFNLYQKPVNGTGQAELLYEDGNVKLASQWSRDGQFIVYS
jgi:Tol biopolymer transport system component